MLNGMAGLTKQFKQAAFSDKCIAQIKDYEVKFGVGKR
jgi:hypothetical protein